MSSSVKNGSNVFSKLGSFCSCEVAKGSEYLIIFPTFGVKYVGDMVTKM